MNFIWRNQAESLIRSAGMFLAGSPPKGSRVTLCCRPWDSSPKGLEFRLFGQLQELLKGYRLRCEPFADRRDGHMRQPRFLNLLLNGCGMVWHRLSHWPDSVDELRVV